MERQAQGDVWEARTILDIITRLKKFYPDKLIAVDKTYNSYPHHINNLGSINMMYTLYVQGVVMHEVESLWDLINDAEVMLCSLDENYNQGKLLKDRNWNEYFKLINECHKGKRIS